MDLVRMGDPPVAAGEGICRAFTEPVRLRRADACDRGAIREFVSGLSARNQRLRFFAGVVPPSSALLSALCGGSGSADVLIVTDCNGAVIAHGMAADKPVNGTVESSVGLVVADAWHRRGVGTMLISALVGRAAARGVSSLVVDVLPDNHVILGIIGRRWPSAASERTPDGLVFRLAIQPLDHWQVPAVRCLRQPGGCGDDYAPRRSAA
jgi:GNAT superfamily N-acetyltransferase